LSGPEWLLEELFVRKGCLERFVKESPACSKRVLLSVFKAFVKGGLIKGVKRGVLLFG